jgi:hypothetical protein
MKSLRVRLIIGMVGSFALLLLVFGLILDRVIEFTMVREFDFYLQTLAKTLAAAAETEGKKIAVRLVPESLRDLAQVEGELFSQYWTADGAVLAKSNNLGVHDLPPPSTGAGSRQARPFALWDGRAARAAYVSFHVGSTLRPTGETPPAASEDRRSLTLAVARDTTDLGSHIRQLRGLLFMAGMATMGVGPSSPLSPSAAACSRWASWRPESQPLGRTS